MPNNSITKQLCFGFVEYNNHKWADLLVKSIRKDFPVTPIIYTTPSSNPYVNHDTGIESFRDGAKWVELGFESNHTKGLDFITNRCKERRYEYTILIDNDSVIFGSNVNKCIEWLAKNPNIYVLAQEDFGPVEHPHRNKPKHIHPSFTIIRNSKFTSFLPKLKQDYLKDNWETYYGLHEYIDVSNIKFLPFRLVSSNYHYGLASKTYIDDPQEPLAMHAWYGSQTEQFTNNQMVIGIKASILKTGSVRFFKDCKNYVDGTIQLVDLLSHNYDE